MEGVIEFIRRYTKLHWELRRENLFGKSTDAAFRGLVKKLGNEFIGYPGGLSLSRSSAEQRKDAKANKADYASKSEPIVLMAVEYKKGRDRLWRVFTSGERDPSMYVFISAIYDVIKDGDAFKIIAESRLCIECKGMKTINGKQCPECAERPTSAGKNSGYLTFEGKAPLDYGTIVEVVKLERPTQVKHQPFYDSFGTKVTGGSSRR